jgi:plasmid stabilization system protein ParE
MARGSKKKYTAKQKRQAEHIEKSYEKRGDSPKKAAQRAWRTVNQKTGGGKKTGGAGRKKNSS